jgi:hypothetical protein
MSDVINEAKVWEWAGVSFGEYELMLLHKSIKMHSLTAKADQVRLWGKIRGSERDYYVLEGTIGTGGGEEGADAGGRAVRAPGPSLHARGTHPGLTEGSTPKQTTENKMQHRVHVFAF